MKLIVGQVGDRALVLPAEAFNTGCAVFGRPGSGKSYLLLLLLVQLIAEGEGVTLIDPDDDTASDLEAYVAEFYSRLNPERQRQLGFFHPGTEGIHLDPFDLDPTAKDYRNQLWIAIDELLECAARAHAIVDYQEFRRLRRIAVVFLYLVGTKVDGKHDGLQNILEWLDMGTAAWNRKYAKVRPFLPKKIVREVDRLSKLSITARERELESTRNLFFSFLSGEVISDLVSPGPSLDFRRAVRERWGLVWNLGVGEGLTREQRRIIAGLVFCKTHNACRHERVQHWLFVEEASSVLGEFGEICRQARKRNEKPVFCNQDLGGYKDQRTDQRGIMISLPGVVFVCQTTGPKADLDELAHLLGTRSIDYGQNWKPMDRPDGYEILQLPEQGFSHTTRNSTRITDSEGDTVSRKKETSTGSQSGSEISSGTEEGESRERATQFDQSNSDDQSRSTGTREVDDNTTRVNDDSRTSRSSFSEGTRESSGTRNSIKRGASLKSSESETFVSGVLKAFTKTKGRSHEHGHDQGESLSIRNHLVPRHREEWYSNGLRFPIDAQYSVIKTVLSSLGLGEYLMLCGNHPAISACVPFINRPFDGYARLAEWKVNDLRAKIRSFHPFFFTPQDQEKCLENGKYKKRRGTGDSSNS